MIFLYAYAACSITLALCIVFEVYRPVLKQAIADGIDNDLTRSPKLGMFVAFLINLALAPAVLIIILAPNAFDALSRGYARIIREQN